MTDQLTLDLVASREARDEAIARVDVNTAPGWKLRAEAALAETMRTNDEFTTDDIDCPAPREPRAWGAVMMRAAKQGRIVNTGRVRPSSARRCHARPKTVWRVVR